MIFEGNNWLAVWAFDTVANLPLGNPYSKSQCQLHFWLLYFHSNFLLIFPRRYQMMAQGNKQLWVRYESSFSFSSRQKISITKKNLGTALCHVGIHPVLFHHPLWVPVLVLVALLSIQFCANAPGKVAKDAPSACSLNPCRRLKWSS